MADIIADALWNQAAPPVRLTPLCDASKKCMKKQLFKHIFSPTWRRHWTGKEHPSFLKATQAFDQDACVDEQNIYLLGSVELKKMGGGISLGFDIGDGVPPFSGFKFADDILILPCSHAKTLISTFDV